MDRFVTYAHPAGTSLGFNVLQLRSNNVVREEFRPGSTLFAVCTHDRDGYEANTFLLKPAYWMD